jgi:hypothetical protein
MVTPGGGSVDSIGVADDSIATRPLARRGSRAGDGTADATGEDVRVTGLSNTFASVAEKYWSHGAAYASTTGGQLEWSTSCSLRRATSSSSALLCNTATQQPVW